MAAAVVAGPLRFIHGRARCYRQRISKKNTTPVPENVEKYKPIVPNTPNLADFVRKAQNNLQKD